jgi:hypothetical protein
LQWLQAVLPDQIAAILDALPLGIKEGISASFSYGLYAALGLWLSTAGY